MLGNEYLRIPGDVELFFPLLLVMFWLAAALTVRSVGLVRTTPSPPWSRRLERGCGVLLVVIAAVVALALHLPTLVAAMGENGTAYRDAPTLFWVVKFYDLGLVVPGALVVGIALLRRRVGARTPVSAIIGGYVLLGWSVAGMAWTMLASGDADGSAVTAAVVTAISVAGSVFAWFLYRPLFRTTGPARRPVSPSPAGAR